MKKKIDFIYFILVFLTILSYFLGEIKLENSFIIVILLLITFIKGKLIINYFMELKNCSKTFILIPTIWLFLVLSLIAYGYFLPHF